MVQIRRPNAMDGPMGSGTEAKKIASRNELIQCARAEADKHKWIESEKAGHDLGEHALAEWFQRYWRPWCRERWIEHLEGRRFWEELDKEDYGLLQRDFHPNKALVLEISNRIRCGGENLDIMMWVNKANPEWQNDAIEILYLLDINSRRIPAIWK